MDDMNEFEVDFGAVAPWADEIGEYSNVLKRKKEDVERVIRQLHFIGEYRDIICALSKIADHIGMQQRQMKQYGGMLRNIMKAYEKTETAIVDSASAMKKVEKALEGVQRLEKDLFSKFGIAGSMTVSIDKLINSLISGETETNDVLKLLKSVVSNGGKAAGTLGKEAGERDWLKCLSGITSDTMADKLKISTGAGKSEYWNAYLQDKKDDYIFSNAKNAGKNVQTAFKYAAAVISFATTALDNKKEQGDVMTARAWEETIVETAVDVAKDFVIEAALAMALGPGAPFIAVSLAATGVAWAVDSAVEAATGKETVEIISDMICDAAEKAADTVVKWGKSTWDTMTSFFSGGNRRATYAGAF